jgi:hypothetical protein
MDDFPIKSNEWINAFVAHNWIAVAVTLSVLSGLAERLKNKKYFKWVSGLYAVCRDAWKVVRPPSTEKKPPPAE